MDIKHLMGYRYEIEVDDRDDQKTYTTASGIMVVQNNDSSKRLELSIGRVLQVPSPDHNQTTDFYQPGQIEVGDMVLYDGLGVTDVDGHKLIRHIDIYATIEE